MTKVLNTILKYKVVNKFTNFLPEPSDFEIVQEHLPPLKVGEFLVKTKYISVDPYIRSFAKRYEVPYEQFGFQVGKVVASKNPIYPLQTNIVSHSGWCDYAILNGNKDNIFQMKPYIPPIGRLPLSLAVGALGMPGITAYLGLSEICKPKTGEIVCVSSAAGTIGLLVGQIAKLKGCKVIGLAGTDYKVQMLMEEFGFDYAFNYKNEENIQEAIWSVVRGIDCYFDNVGGELSAKIMECMNDHGRVAICGSISTYGGISGHKMPVIPRSVQIIPFRFTQWSWPQQKNAINQLKKWIENDTIKVKETITDGFKELPATFIAMLKGDNVGKSVVKV